jgi:hypothetical protein
MASSVIMLFAVEPVFLATLAGIISASIRYKETH